MAVAFSVVVASWSLVTTRRWWVNGDEMFAVGTTAAVLAYTVENPLGGLA